MPAQNFLLDQAAHGERLNGRSFIEQKLIYCYIVGGGFISDTIYRNKDILGLDLGTSSVKFVQLKPGKKLTKLVSYGKVEVPSNIIIEGIISEPEKLAQILKKEFSSPKWGKVTATRVVSSLPESKIFTRIIELPNLGKKDLGEAVKYEIEQSIPIPATDLYIDYETIEEAADKITIFLVAAPRSIIDSYLQLFNLIGLEPVVLEPSLLSISRALVKNKEKSKAIIILDLGGSTTNMAIFENGLKVTESLPYGGLTLKNELIETLSMTKGEATNAIRKGFSEENTESGMIKEELEKISIEIKKIIDYYEEKSDGKKISGITLTGGLAHTPGLLEFIESSCQIKTKIGNPWTNISIYPLKPVPKEQAPAYSAAIGLCLRELNDE